MYSSFKYSLKKLCSSRRNKQESPVIREVGCYAIIDHGISQMTVDREIETGLCPCGNEEKCEIGYGQPQVVHTYLPAEIWHSVVEHAIYYPPKTVHQVDLTSTDKEKFGAIIGLANASKTLRVITLGCWAQHLNLLLQKDVEDLTLLGKSNGIDILKVSRRLRCVDAYKIYQAPANSLEGFGLLQELVIDGHSDIDFGRPTSDLDSSLSAVHRTPAEHMTTDQEMHDDDDEDAQAQLEAIPLRMTYRKLKVRFPATLRALKIYNSHVPDIYFIHKVACECPNLRSLTLARCTMFSRSNCEFWERLPSSESDSYFSNQGIEAYAAAVGKELSKIPKLKEVGIGIYLTNHGAINTHIHRHANLASTANTTGMWHEPCPRCAFEYQTETEASEQAAALVLATFVPTLSLVHWQSFFTKGRTGWHTCSVGLD